MVGGHGSEVNGNNDIHDPYDTPGIFSCLIFYIACMKCNIPRFIGGAIVGILAYSIWPGLAIANATNAGLSPDPQQTPPAKPRLLLGTLVPIQGIVERMGMQTVVNE